MVKLKKRDIVENRERKDVQSCFKGNLTFLFQEGDPAAVASLQPNRSLDAQEVRVASSKTHDSNTVGRESL